MASLEEQFQVACESREIPGVILLASSLDGKFQYQKVFGPKSATEPIDFNTTFILASCTKLMTSISALQCVERGQITLDDDVSSVLTELKDIQIITGFKDGTDEAIMKKAENKITLRHLLSHSAGFGYDLASPNLIRWRKSRGETGGTGGMPILDRITVPLIFEPGTSYEYGVSTDWVGQLVARLSNMSLEEYMQKNIWDPLDIQNITFHQELKPDVTKNLVTMSARGGIPNVMFNIPARNEEKVDWSDLQIYDNPTPYEYGGSGGIGSPVEYMRIMQSILSDDGKLLKSETIDEMFKPQLSEGGVKQFEEYNASPFYKDAFASHLAGTKINWGLAGMVVLEDEPTGRKKGTMSWSGLPNLLWTIDREAGLALMYACNVLPFGDFKSGYMQRAFEKEMYSRHAQSSKS